MSDSLRQNKLNQSHPGIWRLAVLIIYSSYEHHYSSLAHNKVFHWYIIHLNIFKGEFQLFFKTFLFTQPKIWKFKIWNYIAEFLMEESINSHTMEPCLFSHRITSASPCSFQCFSLAGLRQPCFMCLLFGKQRIPNQRHLPSAWFRDVKGPLAVASTGTWLARTCLICFPAFLRPPLCFSRQIRGLPFARCQKTGRSS